MLDNDVGDRDVDQGVHIVVRVVGREVWLMGRQTWLQTCFYGHLQGILNLFHPQAILNLFFPSLVVLWLPGICENPTTFPYCSVWQVVAPLCVFGHK